MQSKKLSLEIKQFIFVNTFEFLFSSDTPGVGVESIEQFYIIIIGLYLNSQNGGAAEEK